jgi:hypothetical protein
VSTEAEDDWHYWKAAISCLPKPETRDAAWEFFARHFSQNPKMADTLSGLILVLQANGLYMLEAPKMFREQVVDPLHEVLARFSTELNQTIDCHKEIATEATQSTERAVTVIKGLEGAIRSGWQEVNTASLAERVHAELEATLLQPLASQCRVLEQAAPAVKEVLEHMENSMRQLRGYHFKSILAAMLTSCLVIAGGCFALGWSKLSHHYELKVKAALERVVSVNATNEETFTQLTKMNVPIRVVPVVDNRKQTFLESSPWLWITRRMSASRIWAMESERLFTLRDPPIEPSPEDENVPPVPGFPLEIRRSAHAILCRSHVCPRTIALCFGRLIGLLFPHGA